MQVDTLVVFYHPARPGLHKRLRGEYRLPPAYVEASHPAAALLDGEQHGWSVAGLALTPIHASVYYWEEVLKGSSDAREVYNRAPSAFAKRLDLFITPRLAKSVDVAAIPEPGEVAAWSFNCTVGHTMLYTMLHMLDWALNLPLRKAGVVRVLVEASLAPPHTFRVIVEAARVLSMLLAAQRRQPVEYRVYTVPHVYEPGARKPPLVDLVELESTVFDPDLALHTASNLLASLSLDAMPLKPSGPKARLNRELVKRVSRLVEKGRAAATAYVSGLWPAGLALACTERNPVQTLHRILSEIVEDDLRAAVVRRYQEGGVLAHHLQPSLSYIQALGLTTVVSASAECEKLEGEKSLEEVASLYSTRAPASVITRRLVERLLEDMPEGGAECTEESVKEALDALLAHPATIERRGEKYVLNAKCLAEAARMLLRYTQRTKG